MLTFPLRRPLALAGVDPTNTGPGDFPGGEIRGQLD
jgi:hypothetical protein